MIYTSNFSKCKKVPHPIAISRGIPPWYEGEALEILAPLWEIVDLYKRGKIDKRTYTERYIIQLADRNLTPQKIKDLLPDECTLLCWEASKDFCHRHIVRWILNQAGIPCKEWE